MHKLQGCRSFQGVVHRMQKDLHTLCWCQVHLHICHVLSSYLDAVMVSVAVHHHFDALQDVCSPLLRSC